MRGARLLRVTGQPLRSDASPRCNRAPRTAHRSEAAPRPAPHKPPQDARRTEVFQLGGHGAGYPPRGGFGTEFYTRELVNGLRRRGLEVLRHPQNRGYGGNQKTCYQEALKLGAEVVVMLHPDYQYTPKLVVAMASMIATGQYDIVLASRILCGSAIRGGMPTYKYVSNRLLTLFQNILMHTKVSEFHTSYRVLSRDVLEKLPLDKNCDDFVFDNEILAQTRFFGFRIWRGSLPDTL